MRYITPPPSLSEENPRGAGVTTETTVQPVRTYAEIVQAAPSTLTLRKRQRKLPEPKRRMPTPKPQNRQRQLPWQLRSGTPMKI
ncbi:hypothetical protein BGX38DRAFT_1201626 [Terfezia claveryi]|nr:hypothetical protein BGX38DRAFT_1201626 [Terfezia claveryi]